jgi:hypothetical protein
MSSPRLFFIHLYNSLLMFSSSFLHSAHHHPRVVLHSSSIISISSIIRHSSIASMSRTPSPSPHQTAHSVAAKSASSSRSAPLWTSQPLAAAPCTLVDVRGGGLNGAWRRLQLVFFSRTRGGGDATKPHILWAEGSPCHAQGACGEALQRVGVASYVRCQRM